jgi:N-acetylglucosamine-6-phosphate deacetylase
MHGLYCVAAGIASFESVYGAAALRSDFPGGVRMITAAPEIEGVIPAMAELTRRGVICSIGHRYVQQMRHYRHSSNSLSDPDAVSPPPIRHAQEFSQVHVS